MRRSLLLALVLLLTTGPAGAVLGQDRTEQERFLREATIVDREVIRSGITLPQVVELELEGVRRRGVFKSFEILLENERTRIGKEEQKGLRDSWKFEVAAYELDRLLGFDMVPATVVRRVDRTEGALIAWVENVQPEFASFAEGFSMEDWEREVAKVWLFDYLAYNIDRTTDNLLITSDFRARLIDHSRAFQRFLIPMRPLARFPRAVIDRLRQLGPADFERALGPYLSEEELRFLLERRERVLARVDELLRSRPESEVLFESGPVPPAG